MARIWFGGKDYPLPDDEVEGLKENLNSLLMGAVQGSLGLSITDTSTGAQYWLWITPGAPVVIEFDPPPAEKASRSRGSHSRP